MTDQVQLPLLFAQPEVLTVEEIWSGATAEILVRLREDKRIERKPAGIHAPELAQYYSMWANTVDGGLVVIGMEDNGVISGCSSRGVGGLNKLEAGAKDNCPDAKVECKRLLATNQRGDADVLLLIRVRYHNKKVVKTAAGDAFIRVGNQKRKLKPEEIRDLESDKGQLDVEQELCPSISFPDDFDMHAVADFVTSVRARTNYPDHLTITDVLELRRLGKRKSGAFVPNAACVLLFARDPMILFPGCKVRFLRHEGDREGTGSSWNVVKDLVVEGTIPALIQGTETIMRQQLREYSRLGRDNKFYTAPEYPPDAWFEAIVNACVHRSYGSLKNMNIFVRMFDDRLEVESPGGFPPPVTPQNIYEMHQPRNPHLMDAMMYLNYVKCAREGTRRMRESMTASDLPSPHFSQRDSTYSLVRVTLRNNAKQRAEWLDGDVAAVVGEEIAKALNDSERRAVNFVAEHGKAHASEIARLLGIDWQTARKLLERLSGRGVLRHNRRTDIQRDPKSHFVLAVTPGSKSPEKN